MAEQEAEDALTHTSPAHPVTVSYTKLLLMKVTAEENTIGSPAISH